MSLPRRRGAAEELNPWPGYVDALSTLLMVIIFVLLVFVLAQAFLSVALSGRDRAVDQLNRQVAALSEMLSLERGQVGELQRSLAGANRDLQAAQASRTALDAQLSALREAQSRSEAERDALRAERDRLSARLADLNLQVQSSQARNAQLQTRLADAATRTDAAGQETAVVAGQLAQNKRALAAVQAELDRTVKADKATIEARLSDIAQLNASLASVQAELDRTVKADKATIEARLSDIARLNDRLAAAQAELERTVAADKATVAARLADIAKLQDQVASLTAARDRLQQQNQDASANAASEATKRQAVDAQLAEAQKQGESARAQIAALSQQIEAMRQQIERVSAALDIAEASGRDKDSQIANLGSRLNAALASKVEELQRYRSEFFGKLSQVLQNRSDIHVVGDRFVFQSEVLFPVGSADLTPSGEDQIRKLGETLKSIESEIPPSVNWILRVDGHADKQPRGAGDPGNWELSAQRAINVVKLLVQEGIPPDRLAATGFGEYQPLDPADTQAAYAKNRRIELRLTDR